MEPEVREFLQRISKSLGIGILWLSLNSTFGVMMDYAFIYDHVTTGNIVFYIFFIASTSFMIVLYRRLWKGKL